MSARGAMTMRAHVKRGYSGSGTDDWGQSLPPTFQDEATVPCWVWSKTRRSVRDDGKQVVIEDLRAIMPVASREAPLGWVQGLAGPTYMNGYAGFPGVATAPISTNIAEGDRLEVFDRAGAPILRGPLAVETITLRRGSSARSGHVELMLTRHV